MTKRSTNDKIDMWNGGETFGTKNNHYNRMWRESEDYLDLVDIESEIEGENEKVRNNINKDMNKPATISGGDPIRNSRKRKKK